MAQFNAFKFIEDRENSNELDQEDLETFDMYRFQQVLSMVKGMEQLAAITNTPYFFSLPKAMQAKAFTTLNNTKLRFKWKKTKVADKNIFLAKVDKVMKLLKCGQSDAISYINNNMISDEKIDDIYSMLYETEKWMKKQ